MTLRALKLSQSLPKRTNLASERSKAVSDGAVIWRATNSVIARSCRFTFGHPDYILFDPKNEEHRKRGSITLPDGSVRVCGAFDPLAIRVSLVISYIQFF